MASSSGSPTATAPRRLRRAFVSGADDPGSEDRINPIDKNAAILLKVLRNGKLEVLEGIGHLPEVEAPDVVNRLLRDFFAE